MIQFFNKYIGFKNFMFIILALLFIIFLAQIKDIAILFFAAFVISCSLNPLVDKLCERYKKLNRHSASAIVLTLALLTCFIFLIPIIITGGEQIGSFINAFPERFVHAKKFLSTLPLLSKITLNNTQIGEFAASATGVTSDIVSKSIMFSKGIIASLIYFLSACLIIYYFMADKEAVKKGYLCLFPRDLKPKAEEILETISNKVGGYVLAQIVTIASVGIMISIGFALLGIDYAIILGLITAIFDLIPVVGPTVALIIILIAVCKLSLVKIILTILVFAFTQWAENNLVRPYVFGKLLDLHPLIIYFFLLITAQFLGIVGLIFAPAIAATFCVLLEELYIKNVN